MVAAWPTKNEALVVAASARTDNETRNGDNDGVKELDGELDGDTERDAATDFVLDGVTVIAADVD